MILTALLITAAELVNVVTTRLPYLSGCYIERFYQVFCIDFSVFYITMIISEMFGGWF